MKPLRTSQTIRLIGLINDVTSCIEKIDDCPEKIVALAKLDAVVDLITDKEK